MFEHMDPRWVDHPAWWGFVGWVIPLVVFLAIVGLVVWAVLRVTSSPRAMPASPMPPAPLPSAPDRALEEVRFQYARGQIDREEYLQRTQDLGGSPGEAPAPTGV